MLGFPLLFQLYALLLAVPYYSKNYASIMYTSLPVIKININFFGTLFSII